MPRPTFYYKDQPVRATGLLPYVNVNGVIYFLFRQTKKQKYMWSDIGGKTDKQDKTIRDTLIREVTEETNNQYNLKKCIDFSKITARLYHNKSKYLLHLIQEDKRFFRLPLQRFGYREHHSGMAHQYRWIPQHDVLNLRIHYRLRPFVNDFFQNFNLE